MQPSKATLGWMYHNMVTSRKFETVIERIYMKGKSPVFNMANGPIPGEMHLSNGQEPVAVGVCAHLKPEDIVTATHRPHHQAIAKGVDLNRMAAESLAMQRVFQAGAAGICTCLTRR